MYYTVPHGISALDFLSTSLQPSPPWSAGHRPLPPPPPPATPSPLSLSPTGRCSPCPWRPCTALHAPPPLSVCRRGTSSLPPPRLLHLARLLRPRHRRIRMRRPSLTSSSPPPHLLGPTHLLHSRHCWIRPRQPSLPPPDPRRSPLYLPDLCRPHTPPLVVVPNPDGSRPAPAVSLPAATVLSPGFPSSALSLPDAALLRSQLLAPGFPHFSLNMPVGAHVRDCPPPMTVYSQPSAITSSLHWKSPRGG